LRKTSVFEVLSFLEKAVADNPLKSYVQALFCNVDKMVQSVWQEKK